MIEALLALIASGSGGTFAKKSVQKLGRRKAIVYFYVVLVSLLAAGALLFGIQVSLPEELVFDYIALAFIGAVGVIGYFKALEEGKISILAPLGRLHVLIVIALSIIIFGEMLSIAQIGGSLLIILSAVVIALDKGKIEKGVKYMAIAILGWGYYFTFLKTFVVALGPYAATLLAESGVAFFVIAYYVIRRAELSPPSPREGRYAIAQGTAMFFGLLLYNFSIASIGAALTASVVAAAPIVNSIVAFLLLGEKLDMHKYVAIVLMIIGLITLILI